MELADRLHELAGRLKSQLDHIGTEEATKNALVMPFINALGYNVFDPTEVLPEFIADVGIKKGEKVDYAIKRDGRIVILIECKKVNSHLEISQASQLYRYFSVTDARFGVLTDGIRYRFFSDLEQPNKMDDRPFFEFNVLEFDEKQVAELKKFAKQTFDLDTILATASELKYLKGVKRVISEEWINPSQEFVRMLASRVYEGRFTQTVREQFSPIVARALHEVVSERVRQRLQSAIESSTSSTEEDIPDDTNDLKDGIETTEEEIQGFYIVKAIISSVVEPKRVFMRDTRSYCGVLLDDNNRKPICRLWFNGRTKYIGLFDEKKNEEKHAIDGLDRIYSLTEKLRETAKLYDE